MSIELTRQGERAYAILRWAQEDPAERAAEARRQVDDLARPLLREEDQAQALREVQDAGAMLARLAGGVDAEPGSLSQEHAEGPDGDITVGPFPHARTTPRHTSWMISRP